MSARKKPLTRKEKLDKLEREIAQKISDFKGITVAEVESIILRLRP